MPMDPLAEPGPPARGGLVLRPRAVAGVMLATTAALLAAHLAVLAVRRFTEHDRMLGFGPMFDLWNERNVPTFASALGLAFCGLLLAVIGRHAARVADRDCRYWLGLAAVFAFLALDEMLAIHDRLSDPLRAATGASGALYHAWVVPYLAALAVLGATFLPFLFRLPTAARWRFVLAAGLYLSGAIGLEMVDAIELERVQDRTPLIEFLNTVEETLEMLGISVFAWALSHELARRRVTLAFETS